MPYEATASCFYEKDNSWGNIHDRHYVRHSWKPECLAEHISI